MPEYEVTERAGRRVAGQVVTVGQTLTLTEEQAEHAILEGTIVPKGRKLHRSFTEGTKRLDGMRAEADAMRARAALPPSVPGDPEDGDEPVLEEAQAGADAGALKDA